MKILVVTQYFWPEQFKILDLCQELIERGNEVTVYTGLPNYPEGEFFKGYSLLGPYKETHGKINIIRSPLIPRGKNKSFQLILNYFSFMFLASLLAPFLVRGKFDKIFIYEPSPVTVAIPAIVLKYLKKAPIIFWVLDLWPESLEATGVLKNKKALSFISIFVKWIYDHCDRIFITSRGFARSISSMGIPENKIFYWPQWAEAFFSSNQESTYKDENIPKDGFKIMFAGNIGSSQDFETIIGAASILRNNKNIKFLIVGDGMMKKWSEEQVLKLKLQNTFIFLGKKPVETMPYYFSHADVMLVSLTDTKLFSITVPAKIQAYLASGKPILASLNGEGADIIRQWNSGMTCTPTNPKQLAQKIEEMSLLSIDALKLMGENARRCYLSEFERDKLISILVQEMKELR
ncbi:MAG TPA: glycosyltransferase family 4 protein [Bacteriovoracaceae bacterium]|nr:glycosyltransferase family 4 protein [Bacteriovoracaceae bacterium]